VSVIETETEMEMEMEMEMTWYIPSFPNDQLMITHSMQYEIYRPGWCFKESALPVCYSCQGLATLGSGLSLSLPSQSTVLYPMLEMWEYVGLWNFVPYPFFFAHDDVIPVHASYCPCHVADDRTTRRLSIVSNNPF
jgi:hypothetical protein